MIQTALPRMKAELSIRKAVVGGSGASIASRASSFAEVEGGAGTTILLPASCADDAVLRAGPGTVCLVAELV